MSKEEASKYDLLSTLCLKDHKFGYRNAQVVYVLRAIEYLESIISHEEILKNEVKEHLNKYMNGETPDYKELFQSIDAFNPDTQNIEACILKKEIASLCQLIAEPKHFDKNAKFNLLARCEKWKPFHFKGKKGEHGGGRNPQEDFFSEVFCYMFEHVSGFKGKVINLINDLSKQSFSKEAKATTQNIEGSNRLDIKIEEAGKSIVIECKVKAGIGGKETVRYLENYGLNYILLTGYSNEVIEDAGIKIKHISWISGEKSILALLSECETSDKFEDTYINYFIKLLEEGYYEKCMSFKEVETVLIKVGSFANFNLILNGWSNAQLNGKKRSRNPGKDGCIFYIVTDKDEWFFPFKITKKGVLNIQWLGGKLQKDKDFKNEFIKKINSLSETPNKSIVEKVQSFNIKDLTDTELNNIIETFYWLADMINRKI